jgi:hypothetical protein
MTQDELKMVLEALRNYAWHGEACPQHPTYSKPENYPKCTCGYDKAITAIKEALAQPKQEPVVGTKTWFEDGKVVTQNLYHSDVYTAPPQRTEQEPVAWQFFEGGKWHNGMEVNDHRKHTEAASVPVRDLYTHSPQRTEPVIDKSAAIRIATALGWTPPRTWAGLTDDDKVLIKHDANFNQFMTAGEYADIVQQLTEARLKDLNT